MIGIISYLPDNEIKEKRLRAVKSQLDWIFKLFGDVPIHVVAQNYKDTDYLPNPNIIYSKYEVGIGACNARNEVLKNFYESNDNWLLLMDDDVGLYDYYEGDILLKDIYYNKYNEYPMDIIIPHWSRNPFKDQLLKDAVEYSHLFRPATLVDSPNFYLLRNKHDNIYYDVTLDPWMNNLKISEDIDYIARQMISGKKVVVCRSMIKKDFSFKISTLYGTDNDGSLHKNLINNTSAYIEKKYFVTIQKFRSDYSSAYKFKIDRDKKIQLPENLSKVTSRNTTKESTDKVVLF